MLDAFATAGGPFRLDFDGSGFTGCIVGKAAPAIVFGFGYQTPYDGVAVDIPEFFRVLLLAGDVEVVIATMPELLLVGGFEFTGGKLFEDLEEGGERIFDGLVCEEMDMFGHQDIGGDAEALSLAGLFEEPLDDVFCFGALEERLAFVATEGDEMKLLGLLEALEAGRHGCASSVHPTLRKRREGWGTRAFGG